MITIEELYKKAGDKAYNDGQVNFHSDVESAFDFAYLPEDVKSKIHWLAWEDGHSAGYVDIVTQYFDLVDLAKLCFSHSHKEL